MAKGNVQVTLTAKDEASAKIRNVGKAGDDLKATFKHVALAAAAAASAIVVAVGKMLTDWSKAGDEIAKMAQRTGWAVDSLSELDYIAKQSGTDLNSIETATKKLSRSIVDASDGMVTYIREFERLNLDVEELMRMSPEEQFWTVAKAIAELEDPTLRTNAAVELFGRSGTDLLPILSGGAAGITELQTRYMEFAHHWSTESANVAVEFGDAMEDVKVAINGTKNALVEELAPAITELIYSDIIPAIQELRLFIDENVDLKQAFLDIVGAIRELVAIMSELYGWYKKIQDAVPDWLKPTVEAFDLKRIMTGQNVLESYQDYLGEVHKLYLPGQLAGMAGSAPGGYVPSGVGDVNVTINGNVMGDEAAIRQLVAQLEPYLAENARRSSFAGVNTSAYFAGSSSK
jgi:hypothetical protein